MQLPGTASLVFLAWVLVFLPGLAVRSARRVAGAGAGELPRREAIWLGTLVSQLLLLVLSWLVAGGFGYDLFEWPALGARELLAAAGALAAALGLSLLLRAWRSESERRTALVYRLAPRGTREVLLWLATVAVASVAEEAAYRGVAVQILWYSLGSQAAAIGLSAAAFSLAHALQGWKSGMAIFAMALVMHGLVALTGSLVLAMLVHALYDVVAGWRIRRDAGRLRAEADATPA